MTAPAAPVPAPARTANGVAAMLAAMVVIGFIDNLVVLISREVGLWQFQILRALAALPVLLLAALVLRQRLRPVSWRAVALRSGVVTLSMALYFGSLGFIPLAQALAGLFSSPIWVLLISALALRQPVGWARVAAVGIGFAGLLLVLDPDPANLSPVIAMPVLGGLFYALGMIATGTICARENTLTLLSWMFLFQIVLSAAALAVLALWGPEVPPGSAGFLLRGWSWDVGAAALPIAVQGIGALLGVGLIIRAYQIGEASYITVFEYAAFVSGPFFAWLLFGQGLGLQQAAGIVLITGAGTLIALRVPKATGAA